MIYRTITLVLLASAAARPIADPDVKKSLEPSAAAVRATQTNVQPPDDECKAEPVSDIVVGGCPDEGCPTIIDPSGLCYKEPVKGMTLQIPVVHRDVDYGHQDLCEAARLEPAPNRAARTF